MEGSFTIISPKSSRITMTVTPGHFTTSSSHVNYYMDLTLLKHNTASAKDVARELATPYIANELVDTIVCMEGAEIVGAFLAEELVQDGTWVMNSGESIFVISPMSNVNGQLVFQHNVQKLISNKNIILLVPTASSGKTIYRALDCLSYYGGKLIGISALFAADTQAYGYDIDAIFTSDDIPDYRFYRAEDCKMCKRGDKLDAIVNAGGYTEL